MFRKTLLTSAALTFSLTAVLSSAIGWTLLTTPGSSFLVRHLAGWLIPCESFQIQKTKGNLWRGLTLEEIQLDGLRGLPPGNQIKIQMISIALKLPPAIGADLLLSNGALRFEKEEVPILFFGEYREGRTQLNLYAKSLDVKTLLECFPKNPKLGHPVGTIADLDLQGEGGLTQLKVIGRFQIDEFSKSGFTLQEAPGNLELKLTGLPGNVFGYQADWVIQSGKLKTRTVDVLLQESQFKFTEKPNSLTFHLRGRTQVERTVIQILLKGSLSQPELKLTSQPPLSQERLLVMLATGQSWEGAQTLLDEKKIPTDLAVSFVDYFLLGSSGHRLMENLGLKGISVQISPTEQGLGVKKSLSEKVDVGGQIKQTHQKENGSASATVGVQAGYQLDNDASVEVQLQNQTQPNPSNPQGPQEISGDKSVQIQYKKKF